jgi:tetratricopeptide (TPR) repeat protein
VELDDNLSEAHMALATAKFEYDFDWAGSDQEFRRALELNPSSSIAHSQYGLSLALRGRFDDGEVEAARGYQLDPLSVQNTLESALALTWKGDFDAAREKCRVALSLSPTLYVLRFTLGLIDVEAGKFNDAIPELIAASEIQHTSLVTGFLGYAYAAAGQRDKAQKILDDLNTLSTKEYVSTFAIAQIYLGLGNREQALEWLQKAYRARSPLMLTVGVSKMFDPVRGDPRFEALVKKMGLHELPANARSANSPNEAMTSR